MTLDKNKNAIKIEYEGQSYAVDADKIEGLDDEQIISLLSVGFPGMAGGKIERHEDGSIRELQEIKYPNLSIKRKYIDKPIRKIWQTLNLRFDFIHL